MSSWKNTKSNGKCDENIQQLRKATFEYCHIWNSVDHSLALVSQTLLVHVFVVTVKPLKHNLSFFLLEIFHNLHLEEERSNCRSRRGE